MGCRSTLNMLCDRLAGDQCSASVPAVSIRVTLGPCGIPRRAEAKGDLRLASRGEGIFLLWEEEPMQPSNSVCWFVSPVVCCFVPF